MGQRPPGGTCALLGPGSAESSCFPIPPDVLLMALRMGWPRRSFWFAMATAVGSVRGGIAGGACAVPLLPFVLVSIPSRGARVLLTGTLVYHFELPVKSFIDRNFNLLSNVVVPLLVGGLAAGDAGDALRREHGARAQRAVDPQFDSVPTPSPPRPQPAWSVRSLHLR